MERGVRSDGRKERQQAQRSSRPSGRPLERPIPGQGTGGDPGGGQLRLIAGAGCRVLPGRETRCLHPWIDARRPRRLPHPRHRIHGGVRIDKDKVGKDLADAIFSGHNNTVKFADVPHLGVKVERGMTHDGLGKYLSEIITKAPGPTADIVGILKATRTDVVVNYLPVGSEEAVKWYAEQVLEAGCAFVNCMPVFLAREPYWRGRFEKRGIPIIGDDIKSQVGATIVHRVLTRLFEDGGVKLERAYH